MLPPDALAVRGGLRIAAPLLLAAIAAAVPARAQDLYPLLPLLEIQVIGRDLVAIDAETGGKRPMRLEREERVLYKETQGRIGVIVTDRRMLAVATRSGTWQEARYRIGEAPPASVQLGDRVALALLPSRVVGFDGGSRNLIETTLGPRERVLATAVGANALAVATDRRALGLSSERGGFFEVRLWLGEQIESLEAFADHVTLQTSQRLLVFRGPTAAWDETRLPVR
jgi:hypothetical protein